MRIVVAEDNRVTNLTPMTLSRPAYAMTCGGRRLIDWLEMLDLPIQAVIRPHLRPVEQADSPGRCLAASDRLDGPVLLVNARLVPSVRMFRLLQRVVNARQPTVMRSGDSIAMALVESGKALRGLSDPCDLADVLPDPHPVSEDDADASLFELPHDLVRENQKILTENLEHRLSTGDYREIADGVFVADDVTFSKFTDYNTKRGPILLDRGASVAAHTYLRGPVYAGPGAKINEHAAVKDAVSLGHTTKIGGEVEASVIEPYTNKQHHGFLGHSYLGSWINLGAGTCNSDLKNTYGNVNMVYGRKKVATKMQFVGCFMGDYAKTAINTGIFTGKTIGVCSMVYGFVTTNVPGFVNYARLFGQVTELPPGVMIQTQQRMFQRRNVRQRDCDMQLIQDMYEMTREERQIADEPLSL